jgi:iron(III) transport system substrate-binding protein
MTRHSLKFLPAVLLMLAAAGCSKPNEPAAAAAGASAPANAGPMPTATSEALADDATKEGALVWYTSNTRPNATDIVQRFEAKYPGIKVDLFQAGGSQILSKVAAELAAGGLKADVVDYSDGAAIIGQARDGLFARFANEKWDSIPAALKDPDGYWVSSGAFLTATFAYNTTAVKDADAPRSWKDLLDPKWKGKITMGSPNYAGTALTTLAAWDQKLGSDYVDKLGANKLGVSQSFGDTENAVVSGQSPIAIVLSFRAYTDQAAGKPIKVVMPTEGQIELVTSMGINAKAAHPKAARLFENFIFSDDSQQKLAQGHYFPARTDLKYDVPGLPAVSSLTLMSPDLKKTSDTAYVAKLKQQFEAATK